MDMTPSFSSLLSPCLHLSLFLTSSTFSLTFFFSPFDVFLFFRFQNLPLSLLQHLPLHLSLITDPVLSLIALFFLSVLVSVLISLSSPSYLLLFLLSPSLLLLLGVMQDKDIGITYGQVVMASLHLNPLI